MKKLTLLRALYLCRYPLSFRLSSPLSLPPTFPSVVSSFRLSSPLSPPLARRGARALSDSDADSR